MAVAAVIPIVAAAASTAVGVIGAFSQASAQSNAANYNAAIANNRAIEARQLANYNQEVANNNATQAENQAAFEADQINTQAARLKGSQIAFYGRSGIVGGSSLDVEDDSSRRAKLDSMSATYRGAVQGQSLRTQGQLDQYTGGVTAAADDSQAQLFKMQASAAQSQGAFSAFGSLLGGGAKTFTAANDAGLFPSF